MQLFQENKLLYVLDFESHVSMLGVVVMMVRVGGCGELFFIVFSVLERLRGGWLNIPLWCVSGVGGGVGRGRSVFTHTHTLLK